MAKQKHNYDSIIEALRIQQRDADTHAREMVHALNTQISTFSLELTQERSRIGAMQDELDTLRTRNEELSESLKQSNTLSSKWESERCQYEASERRIKELETEIANFGEWKNLQEVFQTRLAKVTELERDCERLTRDNKNLHETIGNKLLLEEQVHDLKSRLDTQTRKLTKILISRPNYVQSNWKSNCGKKWPKNIHRQTLYHHLNRYVHTLIDFRNNIWY